MPLPGLVQAMYRLLPICLLGIGIAVAEPLATAPDERHSPAPGSLERRAILEALRSEVRRWHQIEVVFVVDVLTVIHDWAWVQTRPQSPDGQRRYEDLAALLQREQGQWTVVELVGESEETLRQRFPEMPEALLETR